MLSIKAMKPEQEDYYLTLAREDYYLEGGEPPGIWTGRGAEDLGLSGTVEPEALHNLMRGISPDGQRPLIQNAGSKHHQPGWDCTFSAPKSCSTLWCTSDSTIRGHIQDAHHQAVLKAVQYLEDEVVFTRRGKGGNEREPARLFVALYEHGTSRALDPQLHTHGLILNVSTRSDGSTGTIESKAVYLAKMTAGALYRAELAAQLQRRLGVELERQGTWFEIVGVPRALMEAFSQRRAEIEEFLEARGITGAGASAYAALCTRQVKGHVARGELFEQWGDAVKSYHFGPEDARSICEHPLTQAHEAQKQEMVAAALSQITQQQSHFTRQQLLRSVAEGAQTRGFDADEVITMVSETLTHSPAIVSLGSTKGEVRYTTREMLNLERQMLAEARATVTDRTHQVPEALAEAAIERRPTLTTEQEKALRHLTRREGNITVVAGMAGTGKTFLLDAARETWEGAGLRVVGAALAGKAAQGLQEGAGILSQTLAKCLHDLSESRSDPSQQPLPVPATFPVPASDRFRLDARTVWVIDEAGMIGTRQMAQVISLARQAGAKLVLVGDARQLQPIEAGGPFKALAGLLGAAELKEIQRQGEAWAWARQAVHAFADGRAAEGLQAYAERGLLVVADNRMAAIQQIVSDWLADAQTDIPERLILTATNREATSINRLIQEQRADAGELGRARILVQGQEFHEGDRLLFTRNSRLYGVKNGTLGTLESISTDGTLRVRLDSGDWRTVHTQHYPHVRLGYAVTTHKAQGVTAGSVYVLAGGPMEDRELAYVQASRSRSQTRIYVDRVEAGDTIAVLARQMNVSHQKELALAVADHVVSEQIRLEHLPDVEL